jgi:hypothetical protein
MQQVLAHENKTGYLLVQKAGTLCYHNMRIMRSDYDWRCIGGTHEYWSGPYDGGTIDDTVIWIDDMNDGGCKSDKFERDLRILAEELVEKPEDCRTMFYYAQTLRCLGKNRESIEAYRKRIDLGGWFEEVWYSYYSIAYMYLELGEIENAVIWVEKAQAYNNYRAEALYILVKYFRNKGEVWRAMHYLKKALAIPRPPVALFLETHVYDHELLFEQTVLHYYISTDRIEGGKQSMKYLLMRNNDLVFSNLTFYTKPLVGKDGIFAHITPVAVSTAEGFVSIGSEWIMSSCSMAKWKGKRVVNHRFVNYRVSGRGDYTTVPDGSPVRTRNFISVHSGGGKKELKELITPSSAFSDGCRICGMEDVRLFVHGDDLWYTATGMEWNSSHKYRMLIGRCVPGGGESEGGSEGRGEENTGKFTCENHSEVERADGETSDCEKNWLICPQVGRYSVREGQFIDQIPCIYSWKPYRVGLIPLANLQGQKRLIHFDIDADDVPAYFAHLRGSTNLVEYGDDLWCICHSVLYGNPRKYMHHLIQIDSKSYKPVAISAPFSFGGASIEYSLGFLISDTGVCTIIWSAFDSNPMTIEVHLDCLREIMIRI